MSRTIRDTILEGKRILEEACIENAGFDAETMLGFVLGVDRQKLFINSTLAIDDSQAESFFNMVKRRAGGEPLQYITGEQWFMGRRFLVNPSVLIVRPETELLAELAIKYIRQYKKTVADKPVDERDTNKYPGGQIQTKQTLKVLDLCTGSGALAVTLALEFPDIEVTASDISEAALAVAGENAEALGIAGQINFIRSDLFDDLVYDSSGCPFGESCGINGMKDNRFDLIVTNPPYIRTEDLAGLQREIREHEPLLALDGGADGLDFYRRIASEAGTFLKPGGCLMAEIGCDQAKDVSALFSEAGFAGLQVYQDLAGRDRVIGALNLG